MKDLKFLPTVVVWALSMKGPVPTQIRVVGIQGTSKIEHSTIYLWYWYSLRRRYIKGHRRAP